MSKNRRVFALSNSQWPISSIIRQEGLTRLARSGPSFPVRLATVKLSRSSAALMKYVFMVAAALVAERLGKVRLSSARRANERDVPVRVYGSQRPQTFELVNLPAFEDIKVEVVECLELLLRQAAGAKEHLDG